MPGRNKEPIALLVAKGKKHLTIEEIKTREESEIHAPNDNVVPPKFLTKKQAIEFKEIADQLLDLKIMTNLDVDALARFIVSRDMYEQVAVEIRKPGTMRQIDRFDQLSRVQDRFFRACRASAGDLGLTISSRCKLVVPASKTNELEKVNKFAKFEKNVGNG